MSWSSVAAGSAAAARGLPPPSPISAAPEAAHSVQDAASAAPAAWGGHRPHPRKPAEETAAASAPQPLPAAPPPELSAEFAAPPSRGSQPSTAWDSREVSESGLHSPASSRLSAPASPTASHATVRTLSSDAAAAADPWTRLAASRPAPEDPPGPTFDEARGRQASPAPPASPAPAQLPGNLSPAVTPGEAGLFTPQEPLPTGALWDGVASPSPAQAAAGPTQATSLWGAASAVAGTSPATPPVQELWAQQQQQSLAQEASSAGPALPDSLFGDPWANLNVPGGGNPWSLRGDLGFAPGPVNGIDIASAAARVSQLNPSAGVFNAQGSGLSPAAFPAQAPQPLPHATQVHGVQHGLGAQLPAASPAAPGAGGSIWGAPGMSAAAASATGWSSGFSALREQAPLPQGGDAGVWGASPPFNDAPAFLSSLMQQVLPEEDALLPGGLDLLMQGSFRQQQQQVPPGFQLGNLFSMPVPSAAPQPDPRQLWQQQAAVGQLYGQHPSLAAAYAAASVPPALGARFGDPVALLQTRDFQVPHAQQTASLPVPSVRYGAAPEGRQLPMRSPPPGMQGFRQLSPEKGPSQRPSEVVHAFAQVRSSPVEPPHGFILLG